MPHFEIASGDNLVDQPLPIKVVDLEPNSTVTVRAKFCDDFGQTWASYAEFMTDGNGEVDLSSARPRQGTYTDADVMGLFWSMQLQHDNSKQTTPFPNTATKSLKPLTVTLTAEQKGQLRAEAHVTRRFLAHGVTQIDLREGTFVATLFVPVVKTPDAIVLLVLGGSGGGFGWSHQVAALLASHGCVTMALAYFDWGGVWGLPSELIEIPLETYDIAIEYLKSHFHIDLENIGVIGYSKGAELALLLATSHPEIKRVVAYAPSSEVWNGIKMQEAPPQSSWSYQKRPLPFVCFPEGHFDESGWKDEATLEEATIPVEKISGSLLLVSGTEDGVWPSTKMANRIMQRLEKSGHQNQYRHLSFEGAGHNLSVPFLPSTAFDGATVAINAKAERQAWQAVQDFLGL